MKKWLLLLLPFFSVLFWTGGQSAEARRCFCLRFYRPVCGVNGKTYSNICKLRCARVKLRHYGKCHTRPCPLFKMRRPPKGCRYKMIKRNGCRYPKLECSCRYMRCRPGTRCVMKRGRPFCKRACPLFKMRRPPKGCHYKMIKRKGCLYPKLECSCRYMRCRPGTRCVMKRGRPFCKRPCPLFKMMRPPKGCRYKMIKRKGCLYPKLECSCRYMRCPRFSRCAMVKGRPHCIQRCPLNHPGLPPKGCRYKKIMRHGCPIYKLECSCRYMRCPRFSHCVMVKGRPKCLRRCRHIRPPRASKNCHYQKIIIKGCPAYRRICCQTVYRRKRTCSMRTKCFVQKHCKSRKKCRYIFHRKVCTFAFYRCKKKRICRKMRTCRFIRVPYKRCRTVGMLR